MRHDVLRAAWGMGDPFARGKCTLPALLVAPCSYNTLSVTMLEARTTV